MEKSRLCSTFSGYHQRVIHNYTAYKDILTSSGKFLDTKSLKSLIMTDLRLLGETQKLKFMIFENDGEVWGQITSCPCHPYPCHPYPCHPYPCRPCRPCRPCHPYQGRVFSSLVFRQLRLLLSIPCQQ